MAEMTIIEALSELKTIGKRLAKKEESLQPYLWRQEGLKDPIREEGGSPAFVERERQAIWDLQERAVIIRWAIMRANLEQSITLEGQSRSIYEWLIWRKEVAPLQQKGLAAILRNVQTARQQAKAKGWGVVTSEAEAKGAQDLIVNLDEAALLKEIETLEKRLGDLDGQLQLKNATVMITV